MKMSRVLSRRFAAFTLVEILVSMAVLVLLLTLILQIINGAATVTAMGNKSMDADAQARALLDRMDIDIAAMIRRQDVDYYLKGRPSDGSNKQTGNDQMAFYSEVPGYYPSTGSQSPISVVAYRLNSATYKMERLGIGLLWNGDPGTSSTNTAVAFLPVPLASPLPSPLPSPAPASWPTPAWPQAANPATSDSNYETFGPDVFRFEYYYVLKGQNASNPSILSDTPWDTRSPASHASVMGLRDVAGITVVIAVIDPKSRLLVSNSQLAALAGQMNDFSKTMAPGDLENQWQLAVNASGLPRAAASAIRIYGRTFYLNAATP